MNSLLAAIQFLTILPLAVQKFDQKNSSWSAAYFPVVGLGLGLFLCGMNAISSLLALPTLLTNIFLVVALIAITGGMHLDGLSDTADAFLSGKSKDEMLAIMRDPHIGVMGVLALVSALLVKIGLLYSITSSAKMIALVLMCILSRWSVVVAMFLFSYARPEGKAKSYIEGMNAKILILSLIATLLFAFMFWGFRGLAATAIIAACTYLEGKFAVRKIAGITGDTLGAMIEINELIVLLIVLL